MDFMIACRGVVAVRLGLFGCVLIVLIGSLTLRAENPTDPVKEAYQGISGRKV